MSVNQTKIDAVSKASAAVNDAADNITASSTPADVTALTALITKLTTAVNALNG